MFEQFYGFTKTPFGRDLEPSELFQTCQHKEMLARMKYTAERRQFALFTGEVGAGKSTAARLLTDSLHPARYLVLYITDAKYGSSRSLKTVNADHRIRFMPITKYGSSRSPTTA